MNVDVRVGVGGKWTRGVRRRDGHAANGNGSTGGSSVGSSKRGLRMGRGDMYGGTQGVHFVWVERREEASPKRLREAERGGRDEIGRQETRTNLSRDQLGGSASRNVSPGQQQNPIKNTGLEHNTHLLPTRKGHNHLFGYYKPLLYNVRYLTHDERCWMISSP